MARAIGLMVWVVLAWLLFAPMVQAHEPIPPAVVWQIAGIVKGEAPADCWPGQVLTACTVLNDFYAAGVGVLRVCPTCRWHGFKSVTSTSQALGATYTAINGGCAALPICRYLGNANDVPVLSGYTDARQIHWYCAERIACFTAVIVWPRHYPVYLYE